MELTVQVEVVVLLGQVEVVVLLGQVELQVQDSQQFHLQQTIIF